MEVTYRNWQVLPAKRKKCKSSQMVETRENFEEPLQKECEEIHTQDQVVLRESEYNGKTLLLMRYPVTAIW